MTYIRSTPSTSWNGIAIAQALSAGLGLFLLALAAGPAHGASAPAGSTIYSGNFEAALVGVTLP